MKKTIAVLLMTWGICAQAANEGIQEPIDLACLNPMPPVSSHDIEGRKVLTDQSQITVYTFDRDSQNESACSGNCLNIWPPLTVQCANMPAPFGTIVREDTGQIQLTVNGIPLYYFFRDEKPGDLNGEYTDWRPVPVK